MPKELKSVNQLKRLYFLTVCTTQSYNWLPYRPRWINQLYAFINRYFWLPCHLCGKKFGGHEWIGSDDNANTGICPECSLKYYNRTGNWNKQLDNRGDWDKKH